VQISERRCWIAADVCSNLTAPQGITSTVIFASIVSPTPTAPAQPEKRRFRAKIRTDIPLLIENYFVIKARYLGRYNGHQNKIKVMGD
jgi:hypothetical protein